MSETETPKHSASLIVRDMDNILEYDESDVPAVTENFFATTLFPILTDESSEVNFSPWLDIAGSWRRPIDVADADTGKVIFRCPALVGSNVTPKKHGASNSAFDVIEDARRMMANVPRAGNEKILNSLANRIVPAADHVKSIKAWNFIYERYGRLDLIRKLVVEGEDVSTDSNDSTPVVEGYDEA